LKCDCDSGECVQDVVFADQRKPGVLAETVYDDVEL
jgi:hypothetical protein